MSFVILLCFWFYFSLFFWKLFFCFLGRWKNSVDCCWGFGGMGLVRRRGWSIVGVRCGEERGRDGD